MDPTAQEMEEFLCQMAIDEEDQKITAQVIRDLVIQVVKAKEIKEARQQKDAFSQIMTGVSKSIGVLLYMVSHKEEDWSSFLHTLEATVLYSARELVSIHRQKKKGLHS